MAVNGFDEWWHQAYFRTDHPLYEIYKRLYIASADLEYVDALKRFLVVGDEDVAHIEKDLKKNIPAHLLSMLHPLKLKTRTKDGVREYERQNRIRLTKAERKELEEHVRTKVKEEVQAYLINQRKAYRQQIQPLGAQAPIHFLLCEYTSMPFFYAIGKPRDDLGSFVLLALSEYLKKIRGHFRLANDFLRAVRGQKLDSSKNSRLQAMNRLHQFKKSNRDWKYHLDIFNNSYQSFLDGAPRHRFIASLETLETMNEAIEHGQHPVVTFKR